MVPRQDLGSDDGSAGSEDDQGQLPQPAPGPQVWAQAAGQVTPPPQLELLQFTEQAQLWAQRTCPRQEFGPQSTPQRPGPQVIACVGPSRYPT